MGNDISEGAKVGIVLIILCAVVGIIFSLLTMMKNVTNSGSGMLKNELDQLSLSQYQDYDQKIITGTEVRTAMKIFEGYQVGFVLRTLMTQKSGSTYANGFCFGTLLSGYTACSTEQAGDGAAYKLSSPLVKETGASFYRRNLATSNGAYMWNLNTKVCNTSSTSSYIKDTGKFLAELIKDDTDTIVGICFTQTN